MDDEPGDSGIDAATARSIPATDAAHPDQELAVDRSARDVEFTLFYTEQMPRLVAFLIVQGARSTVAAEVAQDVMTDAFRQWDDIDYPRAWVRTVASRTWWRRAQRDQAEQPREDLAEHPLKSCDTEPDEIDNRHAFLALMRSLPLGQRQVMAWTYDGYQPTEIAAQLRIPAATVRSRLRDARAALRKIYGSDEEQP